MTSQGLPVGPSVAGLTTASLSRTSLKSKGRRSSLCVPPSFHDALQGAGCASFRASQTRIRTIIAASTLVSAPLLNFRPPLPPTPSLSPSPEATSSSPPPVPPDGASGIIMPDRIPRPGPPGGLRTCSLGALSAFAGARAPRPEPCTTPPPPNPLLSPAVPAGRQPDRQTDTRHQLRVLAQRLRGAGLRSQAQSGLGQGRAGSASPVRASWEQISAPLQASVSLSVKGSKSGLSGMI